MKRSVRMFVILLLVGLILMPAQTLAQASNLAGVGLLDDFNRANGVLNGNWSGNRSKYRILNNQLYVNSNASNADIYWKDALGIDQEAYVTFVDVKDTATEQNLLLKAQTRCLPNR